MKKILEKTIPFLIGSIMCIPLNYLAFLRSWKDAIMVTLSLSIAYFIAVLIIEFVIPNLKNPFKQLGIGEYKRYYFKTAGSGCLEKCPINSDVRIGSVSCQECENCIDKSGINEDCIWIKCKSINKIRSFNLFK